MGEPCSSRGNFFLGLDFETLGICFITVRGGTWIGPGELFSGAGSQNNGEILHNGGGNWPGPRELFFWVSLYLTLTKARTPTAEAVRGTN